MLRPQADDRGKESAKGLCVRRYLLSVEELAKLGNERHEDVGDVGAVDKGAVQKTDEDAAVELGMLARCAKLQQIDRCRPIPLGSVEQRFGDKEVQDVG